MNVIIEKGVTPELNVDINSSCHSINIELQKSEVDLHYYEGEYEVTPSIDGVQLHTANMLMEHDVDIKPIPYYEVSNMFQGETVYIAKEVK